MTKAEIRRYDRLRESLEALRVKHATLTHRFTDQTKTMNSKQATIDEQSAKLAKLEREVEVWKNRAKVCAGVVERSMHEIDEYESEHGPLTLPADPPAGNEE